MAFDKEHQPGDELEDYGEELSSNYREEDEETTGDEGKDLEEEVSYDSEETVKPSKAPASPSPARISAPSPAAAEGLP